MAQKNPDKDTNHIIKILSASISYISIAKKKTDALSFF